MMEYKNDIPWIEIHHFLLECGEMQHPKEFCTTVAQKIKEFVPYDQARIYYLNDNRTVYDESLFEVDKRWTKAYHEYYSQVENGRYSLFEKTEKNGHYFYPNTEDRVRDWTTCKPDEFINDYLRPQKIQYSFGFSLHDNYHSAKSMFILDRITYKKFTNEELDILNFLLPHLENLYKNFYIDVSESNDFSTCLEEQSLLTKRETEIANLLGKGVSPTNISKKLWICQSTVYKHISHIYEKLNVSNRQELLVKLLHD